MGVTAALHTFEKQIVIVAPTCIPVPVKVNGWAFDEISGKVGDSDSIETLVGGG